MFDLPESAILYADSARGVYIPQHFAESIERDCVQGVSQEQFDILERGPDHESYWAVWCEVEDSARITDSQGVTWVIYQDGDLWLVPEDWTPEEESI